MMFTVILLLISNAICIVVINKYKHLCDEISEDLDEARRMLNFSRQRNRDLCNYFYNVKEDTTNETKRNS